ncbi:MAG: exodeoxyribonuclease VII small subunit [Lachnospiraceae bacterium]|nr:exodeoxyribonuclease VII small subunit [Lachnospiraceae bacterium]
MSRAKKETIEAKFEALDGIVEKLGDEELSLEDAFAAFEQGMKLVKECNESIDRVEKKVRVITGEGGTDEFQ